MKYLKLILRGYKPLGINNIDEIVLDRLDEHFNIVFLGTNGSGKSSVLREVTPLPPNRTDYEPGGYKEITLQHNGSLYVLKSSFDDKKGEYSFLKDDKELNEGHTSTIQRELVHQEFLTHPEILNIANMKFKLSDVQPAHRKSLLMELSPHNLSLVLEKHKQVLTKLRDVKANLKFVYERKAFLEGQFLKEEELRKFKDELNTLKQLLTDLTQEKNIRQGRLEECRIKDDDLESLKDTVLQLKDLTARISLDDGSSLQDTYTRLDKEISTLKGKIVAIEETLSPLLKKSENLQAQLDTLSITSGQDELLKTVQHLREDLTSLEGSLTDLENTPLLDEGILNHESKIMEVLQETLHNFVGQTYLPSQAKYQRDLVILQKAKGRLYKLDVLEESLKKKKSDLENQLEKHIFPDDLPQTNCSKDICPLYRLFMEDVGKRLSKEEIEKSLQEIDTRRMRIEMRYTLYTNYVERQTDRIGAFETLIPSLKKLNGLFQDYPSLTYLFQPSLMESLREPLRLLDRFQIACQKLTLSKKKQLHLFKIQEIEREIESKEAVSQAEYDLRLKQKEDLDQEVLKTTDTLDQLRTSLRGLEQNKEKCLKDIELHKRVEDLQEKYKQDRRLIRGRRKELLVQEEMECLEHMWHQVQSRYAEVQQVVEEQTSLQNRYDEEVTSSIQDLEQKKIDLNLIEKALSPRTGIPHRYTRLFLNAIIDVANELIAMVFTYPFGFVHIKESDVIDYRFKMMVGDAYVEDLQICSDAQKEIANLCFNLAILSVLDIKEYPVHMDEVGRSFDQLHRQRLLNLLLYLDLHQVVSALYLVNHNESVWGGLHDPHMTVLSEDNILLPQVYNEPTKVTLIRSEGP